MLETPKSFAVNTTKLLIRYLSKVVVKGVNELEKRIEKLEKAAAKQQKQLTKQQKQLTKQQKQLDAGAPNEISETEKGADSET